MKSTLLWSLAGLNLLLAAILVARIVPETPAMAQAARRPADYVMIPGTVTGMSYGIVYIVDSSNAQLSAMAWNDSTKKVETMAAIDLNRMFGEGPEGPVRPGGKK